MTATTALVPRAARPKPGPARPQPGPGYPVAPPVADAFAPWAAVLDQPLSDGFRWVFSEEGALVPVPVSDDDSPGSKRAAAADRLRSLLRR